MGSTGERRQGTTPSVSSAARTAYYVPEDRLLPVWIALDVLFPRAPVDGPLSDDESARLGGPGAPRPDGLVLHGEVNGHLHRWCRGTDGRWMPQVSFTIPYASGVTPGLVQNRVLLPRSAVRPHEGAGPRRPSQRPGTSADA